MHNLIEYCVVYLMTLGSLWQYYRDQPALEDNKNIIDFPGNSNNIDLFKFKQWYKRCWNNGYIKISK